MLPPGTAQVKAEFLLPVNATSSAVPDDDAAEGSSSHVHGHTPSDGQQDTRSSGPARGKLTKAQKKAQTGVNKGRRFGKVRDELDLCYQVAAGGMCDFGDQCRNNHDVAAYLAAKPPDLAFPAPEDINNMLIPAAWGAGGDPASGSNTTCPVFAELGECRFASPRRVEGCMILIPAGTDSDSDVATSRGTSTQLTYPFPIATAYQKEVEAADASKNTKPRPNVPVSSGGGPVVISEPDQDQDMDVPVAQPSVDEIVEKRTGDTVPPVDAPDVPMRFLEKKRLDWAGKTYLAPLTTVGNLPFRRLCVSYGADITCGEMGLANSFLAGSKEEWSLVRRHPSEKIFGVQIAGSKVPSVVSAAEVLAKECGNTIDFVDLNCGCPIDLVFKTGSGSALLDNVNRLGKIVLGMSRALGEIPVTVKLRTGVKDGKNTAHKLMPRLAPEFNASAMTLHGRTRQQRYTKLADWEYIKQCVDAVRARETDEDLPRIPIFGGGDCFSSQDYWACVEQSGVDGVMVARGALIKPWIFTEIKEHREWDISARERLEGIRKYAEFGLTHFGTDTAGVNSTRRYLCEALSFQYRYVPIGLLEHLPGRINDRAPAFRGRDELETLLASGDSRDWVRISEMFLGPAPEAWSFTPKHKSNAYESQG
ncbi:tRNA-dihydrouridine(47) synthase [NAD(P)(+)] [Mycena venus]|uniref:tRNA-dihydrouridine(47) synthase [NAD(P)(+)] n=1 Tax=Mycena venus TaxID=2733690 RepID=A0A8H7CLM9_9AGAR|nr:tRNA-dihydrouridine(47) synthase [NAD(P)(+)] [Mycena venus]